VVELLDEEGDPADIVVVLKTGVAQIASMEDLFHHMLYTLIDTHFFCGSVRSRSSSLRF
jgi:hypothetical protein